MRKRPTPRQRTGYHWGLWLGLAASAVLLAPVIEVAIVRFVDPPLTPLMLIRQVEARWQGRTSTKRQYVWLPLAQIPRDFLKFVFVAEDQRFFRHHGFDWREIELARQRARQTGQDPRGASTITMQCARSLFLWQGRSWVRKGLEAYYTFWMEALLSKARILELYANLIEMGDGIYGIEAAARAHYGLGARALSREQCVTLAAFLPDPRAWNPARPTPQLAARCAKILRQEKQVAFPLSSIR